MKFDARTRTYIYAVAVAVMPILVAYGLLSAEQAPLWLALAAALLAIAPPVLAIRNVTPDPATPPPADDDDDDEPADDLPEGGLTDIIDSED